PFDQFDSAPAQAATPPAAPAPAKAASSTPAGNPFDQFDNHPTTTLYGATKQIVDPSGNQIGSASGNVKNGGYKTPLSGGADTAAVPAGSGFKQPLSWSDVTGSSGYSSSPHSSSYGKVQYTPQWTYSPKAPLGDAEGGDGKWHWAEMPMRVHPPDERMHGEMQYLPSAIHPHPELTNKDKPPGWGEANPDEIKRLSGECPPGTRFPEE